VRLLLRNHIVKALIENELFCQRIRTQVKKKIMPNAICMCTPIVNRTVSGRQFSDKWLL